MRSHLLIPLFERAWQETIGLYGLRIRTVAISIASFLSGMFVHYLSGANTGAVWDQLITYVIYGCAGMTVTFVAIFVYNFLSAPFKIHYDNLRAHCPMFWLHNVAAADVNDLQSAIQVTCKQVKMRENKGPEALKLKIAFDIFNGSVFHLDCVSVQSDCPLLRDWDCNEDTPLPRAQLAGNKFHNVPHGSSTEVAIEISITQSIERQLRSMADRDTPNHSSGIIDFRGFIVVHVRARESNTDHALRLPLIDIGTAVRLGLSAWLAKKPTVTPP